MRPGHGYTDLHVALVCHEANKGIQQVQRFNGDEDAVTAALLVDLHPDLLAAAVESSRATRAGEIANARGRHEHWARFLAERGWRQGPRHREAKTHPMLVPWEDLPRAERDKNRVLLGIVLNMTVDAEGCG